MPWDNSDFIKHFYTGNSSKVTLTEAGHKASVKALIDKNVIDRSGGSKTKFETKYAK